MSPASSYYASYPVSERVLVFHTLQDREEESLLVGSGPCYCPRCAIVGSRWSSNTVHPRPIAPRERRAKEGLPSLQQRVPRLSFEFRVRVNHTSSPQRVIVFPHLDSNMHREYQQRQQPKNKKTRVRSGRVRMQWKASLSLAKKKRIESQRW